MKSKSAIFELILALSVLIAGLLAGCKKMPKNVSNIPRSQSVPLEENWSAPLGREQLPTPVPGGLRASTAPQRLMAPSFTGYSSSPEAKQSGIFYSQAEELWIISRPK